MMVRQFPGPKLFMRKFIIPNFHQKYMICSSTVGTANFELISQKLMSFQKMWQFSSTNTEADLQIKIKTKMNRCKWTEGHDEYYIKYHDEEWGVPVFSDKVHFEFLILEGAQAGLSWATILKRREGYRKAFAGFEPERVGLFSDEDQEKLILNPEIIRNKLKISGAINNARRFQEVQKEFGSFSNYIWRFVENRPIINKWETQSDVPPTSPESDKLSKDLKKRGFKFVGSTIIYAHMQACGLVNDHTTDCFRYHQVQNLPLQE